MGRSTDFSATLPPFLPSILPPSLPPLPPSLPPLPVSSHPPSPNSLPFSDSSQVDEVLSYTEQIETLMGSMETCEYRYQNFRDILDQFQKLVDDLNLRSYSNLSAWVVKLDKQVCVCVCVY